MARVVQNDKGFKVIALSHEESKGLDFGIDNTGICICAHCGRYIISSPPTDIPSVDSVQNEVVSEIYYIAVLNDTMDKECYDRWYKGATRYTEDIPIEDRNFNYYKEVLEL